MTIARAICGSGMPATPEARLRLDAATSLDKKMLGRD